MSFLAICYHYLALLLCQASWIPQDWLYMFEYFPLGILAPPSNMAIDHVNDYNQRLTWTPPFTLDITDVDPDITYSVCCNVTTNCTSTTNPYYDFPTLCNPVEFTVTAVNPVGESEPNRIVFGAIYVQSE